MIDSDAERRAYGVLTTVTFADGVLLIVLACEIETQTVLDDTTDPAPTTLDINARYDKLGDAFGAKTYMVTTPAELEAAMKEAIASKAPALIDAQLAADSGKESGHIGYLNPAPLQHITV